MDLGSSQSKYSGAYLCKKSQRARPAMLSGHIRPQQCCLPGRHPTQCRPKTRPLNVGPASGTCANVFLCCSSRAQRVLRAPRASCGFGEAAGQRTVRAARHRMPRTDCELVACVQPPSRMNFQCFFEDGCLHDVPHCFMHECFLRGFVIFPQTSRKGGTLCGKNEKSMQTFMHKTFRIVMRTSILETSMRNSFVFVRGPQGPVPQSDIGSANPLPPALPSPAPFALTRFQREPARESTRRDRAALNGHSWTVGEAGKCFPHPYGMDLEVVCTTEFLLLA